MQSKQYLSAVHPVICSLLWVRYLFFPSKFGGFEGKWALNKNFSYISLQNLRFITDSRVRAKFGEKRPLRSCRKVVWYCLQIKKRGVEDMSEPPISSPLSRSHPKFRERCRPLTCVCVPTLVWIGCGLPDLIRKESKKSIQYKLSAYNKLN